MLVCPRCHTEQDEHLARCAECQLQFKLSRGPRTGAVVGALLLVMMLVGLGVILGLRCYIDNARSAEPRDGLLRIGHLAQQAYERDHRLCPSGTGRIPMDAGSIRGHFYQAPVHEWRDDPGFGCLGYAPINPQYYQYEYRATERGFTARARGDLDGNGKLSLFELRSHIENDKLVLERIHAEDTAE